MMVEVGDRVQVVAKYSAFFGDKGTVIENDGTDNIPFHVNIDDSGHVCWFDEEDLKVLYEEETSMKFKVGDKVKVKDSWFGHDGQVGVIFKIDNYEPYNYSVKFDVEGDNERYDENFKGDSLELVKQQFTKSDLKTGMGVVIDGRKGHVLIGTHSGDVVRFLDNCNYINLSSYREDMTHERNSDCDISEVRQTEFTFMYMTDRVFEEELLFKRNKPKKVTKQELAELLGYEVEVID